MSHIRVMLADDEAEILAAIEDVIGSDPSIDIVGTASDTSGAIDLAQSEAPDVALIDVRMPGGGGARATREIRRRSPDTRVVAYSAAEDPDTVLSLLRAGAVGYVAKDESSEQILRAIHRSVEGRTTISVGPLGDVADRLAEFHAHRRTFAVREATERIQRALDDDSLHMVFQPIVEIGSGHIAGLEALARFATKPRRNPQAWFAEAARVGMLTELELTAVRRALVEVDHLPPDVFLSVNVSPETMRSPGLLDVLATSIGDRIVVEMTEQSPVVDYDEMASCLLPIREMGVRFAIDDVGAGFASLRHVVALNPDYMKVDRTLVTDVDTDPVRLALVDRLVSFTHEVGMDAIAEGIETEAELTTLRTLGIPYGQGFYLGRPGPIPGSEGPGPLIWPGRYACRSVTPMPPR